MNTTHQFSSQVTSIFEAPEGCNGIPEIQIKTDRKDSSFSIVDSKEMELFSLMSPAGTDDAAILYIEKGEVTLVHDLKTYILSKGMLLYKIPKVTVQLLSFSKDCHLKVFRIKKRKLLCPLIARHTEVPLDMCKRIDDR